MFQFSFIPKYLNCVISYEVLTHLRNSYNTIRCDPPSLFKVTFQAALVYLFAIVVFIIHYVIGIEKQNRLEQGNFDRNEYLNNVDLYWSLVITYIFPIVFFGYVWITIWCRGYMSSATGEMKQVVSHLLFFFHAYTTGITVDLSLPKNRLTTIELLPYIIIRSGTSFVSLSFLM